MKYLLIGKRATQLGVFQKLLSENNPDDEFEICKNVKTLVKPPDTKIIYVFMRVPYTWEWEFGGQLDVHSDDTEFVDELMDFRELDTDLVDIRVDYDGAQLTGTVQEIIRKMGEDNESSSGISRSR